MHKKIKVKDLSINLVKTSENKTYKNGDDWEDKRTSNNTWKNMKETRKQKIDAKTEHTDVDDLRCLHERQWEEQFASDR